MKLTIAQIAARVAVARNAMDVLGVSVATANDPELLKLVHRDLMRALHPDRCQHPKAPQLCAAMNVAYDTLTDPKRRRMHDLQHRIAAATCAKCTGLGWVLKQKGVRKVQVACPVCHGVGGAA